MSPIQSHLSCQLKVDFLQKATDETNVYSQFIHETVDANAAHSQVQLFATMAMNTSTGLCALICTNLSDCLAKCASFILTNMRLFCSKFHAFSHCSKRFRAPLHVFVQNCFERDQPECDRVPSPRRDFPSKLLSVAPGFFCYQIDLVY